MRRRTNEYTDVAAKKPTGPSFETIMRDINAGKFEKVYLLEGEESYFIDTIAGALAERVMPEEDKAFNYFTYYGADAQVGDIVNTARSYPLGAERLLIIIREAQLLERFEDLVYYMQRPLDTTILVICYKNGKVDGRGKLVSLIKKIGVVFEARKLYDDQLPGYISVYLRQRGLSVASKAASMLAGNIGADLNRLNGELDKLIISMPQGQTAVTPEMVEQNVGISKDFNYFELQDAIARKDVFKATQIIQYFGANKKSNPLQRTLVMLFRYFSKLMVSYYSPDRSPAGLAMWLDMTEWQVKKNILPAQRNFSARKVMEIIGKIREADEHQKGIGCDAADEAQTGFDLIYFILH